MEEAKLALEVATRYWTLANIVTAFGVLQTYAFIYALGEKESIMRYFRKGWWLALFILTIGTCVYFFLNYALYNIEEKILETQPSLSYILESSNLAYYGRQLVILLMLGLMLTTLFGDRIIHSDKY